MLYYTPVPQIGVGCSLFYLSRWSQSTEAGHHDNKHGLVPTLPGSVLASSFTLRAPQVLNSLTAAPGTDFQGQLRTKEGRMVSLKPSGQWHWQVWVQGGRSEV